MLANLVAAALISVVRVPAAMPANLNNNGPAVIPTTIAFGAIDPNGVIPTVDGVPLAGVDNWDIAWPLGMLARGTSYAETFSFQDARFTGTCNFLVTITSKKTGAPAAAPIAKANTCAPGDIFMVYSETGPIQGSPGAAEAKLTIYYGDKQTSFKVPLLIQ